MVWSPPPENPILHIRGPEKTLCGKSIGRCYFEGAGKPATCPKCCRIALAAHPYQGGKP